MVSEELASLSGRQYVTSCVDIAATAFHSGESSPAKRKAYSNKLKGKNSSIARHAYLVNMWIDDILQ
jgi:hypothetical protein